MIVLFSFLHLSKSACQNNSPFEKIIEGSCQYIKLITKNVSLHQGFQHQIMEMERNAQ